MLMMISFVYIIIIIRNGFLIFFLYKKKYDPNKKLKMESEWIVDITENYLSKLINYNLFYFLNNVYLYRI